MIANKWLVIVLFFVTFCDEQDSPYNKIQMISTRHRLSQQIGLGTPAQKLKMIYDTGSCLMYVPSESCEMCTEGAKFDESRSSTFQVQQEDNTVMMEFISGFAGLAYIGVDVATFDGWTARTFMGLVTEQSQESVDGGDGLLGMCNHPVFRNIFEIAEKNGSLVSSTFAFEVGRQFLGQPSYFYYNISNFNQFQNFYTVEANSHSQWIVPVQSVKIGMFEYDIVEVLLDTGSPSIVFSQKFYNKIYKNLFKSLCINVQYGLLCSCQEEKYHDIEVQIGYPNMQSQVFVISVKQYLTGKIYEDYCTILIKQIQDSSINILGLPFFAGRTTLFDKKANTVSFSTDQLELSPLFPNSAISWALNFIEILVVVFIIILILKPKHRGVQERANSGTEMSFK